MLTAQIVGNVGGEPELKYSGDGNPYLKFYVASNDRRRNRDGEFEDVTEWVQVTVLRQRAETLHQYIHKGMKVFVSGKLTSNPWVTNNDELRSGMQMLADYVEFMSPRQDDDGGQAQQRGQGGYGGQQRGQGGGQRPQQQQQRRQPQQDEADLDDLPF